MRRDGELSRGVEFVVASDGKKVFESTAGNHALLVITLINDRYIWFGKCAHLTDHVTIQPIANGINLPQRNLGFKSVRAAPQLPLTFAYLLDNPNYSVATLRAHLPTKQWGIAGPGTITNPVPSSVRGWATSSTFEVRASGASASSQRSEQLKTASGMDAARLNGDSCPRMRRKPVGNSSNTG